MDIESLIKKYELKSEFEDFEDLNIEWFKDNGFNLEDNNEFKGNLKEYLVYGFEAIYDFLYNPEKEFNYCIKFYINLFEILYELENNFIVLEIIKRLKKILKLKDLNKIKNILNYIKDNLLDKIYFNM